MTQSEFSEWKEHPLTKKLFVHLREAQSYHEKKAAMACLNNSSSDLVAIDNAFNAGMCAGLEEAMNPNIELEEDADES